MVYRDEVSTCYHLQCHYLDSILPTFYNSPAGFALRLPGTPRFQAPGMLPAHPYFVFESFSQLWQETRLVNLERGRMTGAVTKDCFLFSSLLLFYSLLFHPCRPDANFVAPPSSASPGITHDPGHITSYHVSVHWPQGYQVIWPSSVLYTACA